MRAIDTNVLARLLIGDDPAQAATAAMVVSRGVFLPLTVLMETAWLLESRYRMSRREAHAVLATLVASETVALHDRDLVDWALERYGRGKPLTDMLHLVASVGAESFATFDQDMPAQAGGRPPLPIEVLTGKS